MGEGQVKVKRLGRERPPQGPHLSRVREWAMRMCEEGASSECKGPEAATSWACLRNIMKASAIFQDTGS